MGIDKVENNTELYVLVAATKGYFLCPLCPAEATNIYGKYFLEEGEVYKYGQTINPETRYSIAELARWNLEYIELDYGNKTTMTVKETTFMAYYPLLPENLKRPEYRRLVTPPGSGVKLR